LFTADKNGSLEFIFIWPTFSSGIKLFDKLINQYLYKFQLNRLIAVSKPHVVIAIMFHPIDAIRRLPGIKYIAGILDIPPRYNIGKFDKYIYRAAYKKIKHWDHVWASDELKAGLLKEQVQLRAMPVVCYNCPSLDYFGGLQKKDARNWLRNKLAAEGYKIDADTLILLRSGAVGEHSGIEETIEALHLSGKNYIFLILGRPTGEYLARLNKLTDVYDLKSKVVIWSYPNDELWKKALMGADIGHLIQVFDANTDALYVETNNSNSVLSANRFYQYFAAGLPILSFNDKRLNDIHSETDCFYICDTNQLVQSVHGALNYFSNNPQWRQSAACQAKNAYLQKYNWENQFQKISKLLN
jgi:glycosyltransferase involved in cell wall biosynthesis